LLNLLPPGLVTIPTNYLVLLVCCTLLLENNRIAEQNVGFVLVIVSLESILMRFGFWIESHFFPTALMEEA